MKRTTLSLIACAVALAAVTGFAALATPDAAGTDPAAPAARLPVERTSLLCPAPSTSDLAETTYTSFTPVTEGADGKGGATLTAAQTAGPAEDATDDGKTDDKSDDDTGEDKGDDKGNGGKGDAKAVKPVLQPKAPGTPVTGTVSGADAPALIGTAEGGHAPGWTVQQTTEVSAGTGRGLQGLSCGAPDTEFWFPGASTATDRTDYVHLTNPDDSAAVVDIELYGKDGALKSTVGEGITVPPHAGESLLLSTLSDVRQTDLTVHVGVRSGRVGAAVQALDAKTGGDWLTASTDPAGTLVLPGIPEDAKAVRLTLFTPGGTDADLKVQLASPSGLITPAGHETVHVKAGMTTGVDLGEVTRGEAGSLVLTPTDRAVPVVAAVRIVRGEDDEQESAFIPASDPVGARATSADNRAKGTTLSLTAPGKGATVKVTASAGTEGGATATKTYTLKAGTTQDIVPPTPAGLKGTYALTVETVTGGPVYAARTLTSTDDDDPASFTTQTLPDDRGTVSVPRATEDLSVVQQQ